MQPAFLSCTLVLALSGIVMSVMIETLGGYLTKVPLPLRRPLQDLDAASLAPFQVVARQTIRDRETLTSLGTDDYIQWVLEDAESSSPLRRCMVFITYYPLPDKVPHVPEECYLGGGFQQFTADTLRFSLGDDPDSVLHAKYLVFGSLRNRDWGQAVRVPVVYFFKVNGAYASDRGEARVILNENMFGRSSYFSKVELVFNQGMAGAGEEAVRQFCAKLLQRLVPVLERDHWPRWDPGDNADAGTPVAVDATGNSGL